MAGGCVCASCFAGLQPIVSPCCPHCGEPLSACDVPEGGGVCATCRQNSPLWRYARAAFAYNDMAQRLVFPIKYGDRPTHASSLAGLMKKAASVLIKDDEVLLIPVPLHSRKLTKRQYNQAALLARCLARQHGVQTVINGLCRRKNTRSLASLKVDARQEELRDAFVVPQRHRARLQGKHVIVVDDILTTGATAEACTRALFEAGCRTVDILVATRSCTGSTD